jgi:hypothetical protein
MTTLFSNPARQTGPQIFPDLYRVKLGSATRSEEVSDHQIDAAVTVEIAQGAGHMVAGA